VADELGRGGGGAYIHVRGDAAGFWVLSGFKAHRYLVDVCNLYAGGLLRVLT
jgi:hypothetical protein